MAKRAPARPSRQDAIISAVLAWQANDTVHPLTCGKDSSHRPLEPVKEGRRVILKCPDCDYIQTVIPQVVIEMGPKLSRSVRVGDSGPMVPPIGVPVEEPVSRMLKVKPPKRKQ